VVAKPELLSLPKRLLKHRQNTKNHRWKGSLICSRSIGKIWDVTLGVLHPAFGALPYSRVKGLFGGDGAAHVTVMSE